MFDDILNSPVEGYEYIDPVHEYRGFWYFWDETWSSRMGPFESKELARNCLKRYVRKLNGEG